MTEDMIRIKEEIDREIFKAQARIQEILEMGGIIRKSNRTTPARMLTPIIRKKTENNEHAVVTIDELREIAEKNTRWRKAVEDLLDDDDVILSSMAPLGTAKTTWRQVKALAEQWSEEKP